MHRSLFECGCQTHTDLRSETICPSLHEPRHLSIYHDQQLRKNKSKMVWTGKPTKILSVFCEIDVSGFADSATNCIVDTKSFGIFHPSADAHVFPPVIAVVSPGSRSPSRHIVGLGKVFTETETYRTDPNFPINISPHASLVKSPHSLTKTFPQPQPQ